MANISFTKLGCKINNEKVIIDWNGNPIEIVQYLPILNKIELIENVVNQSMTEYNYSNPIQENVFLTLQYIQYYTNIKFTDKQMEDIIKLYDLVVSSGLFNLIYNNIPTSEKEEIESSVHKSLKAYYDYNSSVLGILEAVKNNYSNLGEELNTSMGAINDPESLKFLKQIAPLLRAE